MINYSIIIPHRNIPNLLKRCLDSIPARDDIQVIVVDDASNPEIVDFENFPGRGNFQVEIYFTKEGKGAGYARNIGLSKAKGRWLLFADADDFYNDCFLSAIDKYLDSKYDIVYFDSKSVSSDTLLSVPDRNHLSFFLKEKEIERLRYSCFAPWAKMLSRDFVLRNHVLFDETMAGNDVMFSVYTGHLANEVALDMTAIYSSTVRNDSLWHGRTYESLLAYIWVDCRYNRFLRKIGLGRYRIYSFAPVADTKRYGVRSYLNALFLYLRKESIVYIYQDFYNLLRAKLQK